MAGRRPTPQRPIAFVQTPSVGDARTQRALDTLTSAVHDLQSKVGGGSVDLFTSTTDGTVPASGGGTANFLRADGTWAAPAAGGAVDSVSAGSSMVSVSPTTGAVVVDVVPANFTGIPQAGVTNLVTDLADKSDVGHTHPESDIINLVTDLAAKVPGSRVLTTTAPLRIDAGASADLSADRTLSITTYAGSSAGAVPAGAGSTTKFLREDGTWAEPSGSIQVRHWIFGSGYDGAINFDGTNTYTAFASKSGSTYTLTRTIAASSIIVATGVILKTAGYAIFCTGTLSGSGTIRHNGNDGSTGGTGGAGLVAADLPGSGAGSIGTPNTSSAETHAVASSPSAPWYSTSTAPGVSAAAGTAGSNYCQGGAGGGKPAGAASSATPGANGGAFSSFTSGALIPHFLITGRTANSPSVLYGGATGGGGGSCSATAVGATGATGPGGGSGGGWIVICAYEMTFSGTVEAYGGNGAAGPGISGAGAVAGGGGGGGGGGTIVLVIGTGLFPTTNVAGGTGGAAGAGTGGASSGFAGGNGSSGYVHQWSVATAGSGGGGGGSLMDGDYGDITISGGGTSFNIDAGVVTTTELGGDITTAGKALLDDASASAQRTTLGLAAIAASGSGADLTANTVTLGKLATVATSRILGRATAGTGDVESLTGTQATALLDAVTTSAKGLVPTAPNDATKYLDGTGAWSTPAGSGSGSGSVFSGISAYHSTTQSHTSATWLLLAYDSELYDTDTYHSTSSNNSRFTAPATGYYLVRAAAQWATSSSGGRHIAVCKNSGGSISNILLYNSQPGTPTQATHAEVNGVVSLAAGDYLEVFVYQDSGGTLNVTKSSTENTFNMTKVAGIAGAGTVAAAVHNSTTQSISHITNTALTFDTEVFDTASIHSTSSNTSRLTAPAAGYYVVSVSTEFVANANGHRYLKIRKNGSTEYALSSVKGVVTYNIAAATSAVVYLAVGDYVEAVVYQDSGGSLNVNGRVDLLFSMVLVQATSTTPVFSGTSVYNTSTQSISNTTYTALTYDSESYDTDSYHSTGSNTSRLTAPSTGYYGVTGFVAFDSNSTGYRIAELYKNGTTRVAVVMAPPVTGDTTVLNISKDLYLAAGDYIELRAWQSSGGALNVTKSDALGSFQMRKLGI